ncbi:hypothetical protein LVJ83_11050 [Uruburuella testudinis]|uniref:Uncharacterized protein n=1 Tax=Uruburuella testudinis TaxID=1282863 RepID=A0ABY4DTY2_9NEIS|nr:hypothetical protein [Uruburuella testudinis]UOO81474.1 hypothetical protein LVJ83_11050 [Uruburuella testudinis]
MIYLKLMADYFCSPVWDDSSNYKTEYLGGYNIELTSLPISLQLIKELEQWAACFDDILVTHAPQLSDFESPQDEDNFHQRGRELADKLQNELGADYVVRYWKE